MPAGGQKLRLLFHLLVALLLLSMCLKVEAGKKDDGDKKQDKKPKKKKDIRDFNDADMARLFDEWEEHEEEHDPDDLMEHERPPPKVDLSKIDPSNPESAVKLTKKGKTLMLFVTVAGNPTQEEAEKVTSRWQTSLFNANFNFKRYPVSSNRAIFLLEDGSLAWEIKDFLIQQEECEEVTIESQVYYGKGSGKKVDGKGQIIGVDIKDEGKKSDKKKTTKNSPPAADKQKKSKSSDSKEERKKTVKPTKDKSKENSTKKRDSQEAKGKTKDKKGGNDETFFPQVKDIDEEDLEVGHEERGTPTERAKKAKEKFKGYKSAQKLEIPIKEEL